MNEKARQRAASHRAVTIWTARIIPLILVGIVGYATYVFIVRLCVHSLLHGNDEIRNRAAAIVFITVYFILFLPMALTYFRIVYTVQKNPGYIPLGAGAQSTRKLPSKKEKQNRAGPITSKLKPERSADSPGTENSSTEDIDLADEEAADNLSTDVYMESEESIRRLEAFWKKDVFVCMNDGKPKWCSECANWKPDRTHHCSDVGRCVDKMDHFCPWVGGVVAAKSFKFFFQFVTYTALYTLNITIILSIYIALQHRSPALSIDPQFCVILGIAAFFFIFTTGMSSSSLQFIVQNLSTIENLNRKTRTMFLAVYIPDREVANRVRTLCPTITYPLARRDISQVDSRRTAEEGVREFAIIRTKEGENPWDLGPWGNWKSVMGGKPWEWFLPIKSSPCTDHSGRYWFEYGHVLDVYKRELGIS